MRAATFNGRTAAGDMLGTRSLSCRGAKQHVAAIVTETRRRPVEGETREGEGGQERKAARCKTAEEQREAGTGATVQTGAIGQSERSAKRHRTAGRAARSHDPDQWAAAVSAAVRKGSVRAMEIYAERIEGKALSEIELLDIEEIISMRANLRAQAEATAPRLVKRGEGNAKTDTALE